MDRVTKSGAVFDKAKLSWMNGEFKLHHAWSLSYATSKNFNLTSFLLLLFLLISNVYMWSLSIKSPPAQFRAHEKTADIIVFSENSLFHFCTGQHLRALSEETALAVIAEALVNRGIGKSADSMVVKRAVPLVQGSIVRNKFCC